MERLTVLQIYMALHHSYQPHDDIKKSYSERSAFFKLKLRSENTEEISAPFYCDLQQNWFLFGQFNFVFYLTASVV
jgi:hypothetical protein